MRYTVVWVPSAERYLAHLYNTAADPQTLSDAANRVDVELGVDAHDKGYQTGLFRVYTDDPLAVLYEVSQDDRLVRIIAVRRTILTGTS